MWWSPTRSMDECLCVCVFVCPVQIQVLRCCDGQLRELWTVYEQDSEIHKKVNLSLCLHNHAALNEDVWGSGCIDPYFLDLDSSWRWIVSFTPRSLYPRGKSLRCPLDRSLGGPRSGLEDVEKREFLTLPGLELRPLGRPAHCQLLYRLRCTSSLCLAIRG
jgi:hypothetical protein